MNATETLRQLLNERGVKWHGVADSTYWGEVLLTKRDGSDPVYKFKANKIANKLSVHLLQVTPEQAIAATLGKEICRNTQTDFDFMCSECGKCVDNGRVLGFNYCPSCGRKIEK